jgi:hypothetical protein
MALPAELVNGQAANSIASGCHTGKRRLESAPECGFSDVSATEAALLEELRDLPGCLL